MASMNMATASGHFSEVWIKSEPVVADEAEDEEKEEPTLELSDGCGELESWNDDRVIIEPAVELTIDRQAKEYFIPCAGNNLPSPSAKMTASVSVAARHSEQLLCNRMGKQVCHGFLFRDSHSVCLHDSSFESTVVDKESGENTSEPLSRFKLPTINHVIQKLLEDGGRKRKNVSGELFVDDTRTDRTKKQYTCQLCEKNFTQRHSLLDHLRSHTSDRPFKCDLCNKYFTLRNTLTKHLKIHTGVKPYQCDTCQKSFLKRSNLLAHVRVHTGEKPFSCDVCNKNFSQRSHLSEHRNIHSGEKVYTCGTCGRSFSQRRYLLPHLNIHTGQRPHRCQECGKGFTHRCSLAWHRRIHTVN